MTKVHVEDLSQVPVASRTSTLDVTFSEEEMIALVAEAERRGVTVEEYVLWCGVTAAESTNAGGPIGGGKA